MRGKICFVLFFLFLFAAAAAAGDLDTADAPDDAAGAMFTLEALYQRLDNGAAGARRGVGFAEPLADPAPTGHTLDEVMQKAPEVDDAAGATAADRPPARPGKGSTT